MSHLTLKNVEISSNGELLTFFRNDRPSHVVSLDIDGVMQLVDFLVSMEESGYNRRQAYRVVLWDDCGLAVTIRMDQQVLKVVGRDISFNGIFVEMKPSEWINMPKDSIVTLNMEYKGESETVNGIVKRSQGKGYGIHFPNFVRDGRIDAPRSLTRIVMELQRQSVIRHTSQPTTSSVAGFTSNPE